MCSDHNSPMSPRHQNRKDTEREGGGREKETKRDRDEIARKCDWLTGTHQVHSSGRLRANLVASDLEKIYNSIRKGFPSYSELIW